MKTIATDKIKTCIQKVKVDINREFDKKMSASIFISLEIEPKYQIALLNEQNKQKLDIDALLKILINTEANRIALVGGPGAGKSTLLLKLALLSVSSIDNELRIPIYIKCGLYNCDQIEKLIHVPGFNDSEKNELLENGQLLIIFDGINEMPNMDTKECIKKITIFSESYPNCRYIFSCRTLEYPDFEYSPFDKYSVLAITDEQIRNALIEKFGDKIGNIYCESILYGDKNFLFDVCRTPLLLSLVMSILSNKIGIESLKEMQNISDLYKYFYDSLIKRHRQKPSSDAQDLYFELRDELFKALSYYMQCRKKVYISESELIRFIRNKKYQYLRSNDIIKDLHNTLKGNQWYLEILNDLIRSGFLTEYESEENASKSYSFIHQSFQEYFAGSYLCLNEQISSYNYTAFLLQPDNNDDNNSAKIRRNCMTIEFASCQDKSQRIIFYTMRYAQKQEDSDALILVANCIIKCANGDSKLVDNCCILLLEAFKYWNIPYKYSLIYKAKELLDYVSLSFPERLRRDIQYFSTKYMRDYSPVEYPELFDYGDLTELAMSENIEYVQNAIFTLGERVWTSNVGKKVLEFLFALVNHTNFIIREQSIKSIKGVLEHNPDIKLLENQFEMLISIIQNIEESAPIRTYALNAIAKTGDIRAVEIFMDYLKEKGNPYRDSASWSLQELVLSLDAIKYSIGNIKKFYFDCLINESNDLHGMYSKGNLVYTLSKLNATEYIEQLIKWIKSENEPYVQEDGINAIGVLSTEKQISFIKEYTTSSDPVVRSKAYRSILNISESALSDADFINIKNDSYLIVSQIMDREPYLVKEDIDQLMMSDSKNNEFSKYQQNYGDRALVINNS